MHRLKALLLHHPLARLRTPWSDDLIQAISERHDLAIFDCQEPAEPQFEGIEVVVDMGGNISGEMIDVAAQAGVKFIQVQTNGLDHVEVDKILGAGMTLAHCPGQFSSVALAEGALMFILLHARHYKECQSNFSEGKIYFPAGRELSGRSLGLIGFGSSGQDLARRAKPFGMRILAIDVRPIEQEVLDEIQPDFLGGPDDLDRVVSESDYLSLHLHLNDRTRHIIDARRLGLMRPTACLINVARGELVDEEALHDALMNKRIGGAGLDVFSQEPPDPTQAVYQLPNVYVTPHTSGGTDGTSRKRALFAADNLDRYARGEEIVARVS